MITKDTLINHPDAHTHGRALVVEAGHLIVNLTGSRSRLWISRRTRRRIYRRVLDPLSPAMKKTILYGLNESNKRVRSFLPYLSRNHGRHELVPGAENCNYFDKLFYFGFLYDEKVRGAALFQCDHHHIHWDQILDSCCDPMAVRNPASEFGASALRYAREHSDNSCTSIILTAMNSGVESLAIVASRNNLLSVFEVAARRRTLTRGYLMLLGLQGLV